MTQFRIVPIIKIYEKSIEFLNEFSLGKEDLIITSHRIYDAYLQANVVGATVLYCRDYGQGEPTDVMVEKMYEDIKSLSYNRVIAIGGGTVIDVAKLFALDKFIPIIDLFDKKLPIIKNKELIIVPTTCGTGSEVTNISILELTKRNTKLGLAVDELYADYAILTPELLEPLPFSFFATSSIDALIHGMESYLSPKATPFSKMYSKEAIKIILKGYQTIAREGKDARKPLLKEFLLASTYAGIAFGNAGCAAVHAMSYPLGAIHHIAHGESNYAIFTEVFKTYEKLQPEGMILELNALLSEILECSLKDVYDKLDDLLSHILKKKSLHEYGVTKEELIEFTDNVMTKQTRLMSNNYTTLDRDMVYSIYCKLL